MVPHGRLKQEDCKFEVNLGYTARAISKNQGLGGWGDGSADEAFALQAQGPEFNPYHPLKKPGMVACLHL